MMTSQDKFALAHAFTAPHEGGVCDDPDDTGGYTAYGVSTAFARSLAVTASGRALFESLGIPMPITRQSMRAITPEAAAALFRSQFWDEPGLDSLPAAPAILIYDAAVNCGVAQSVKFAQRGYNACARSGLLAVDGILGPLTRQAMARSTPAVHKAMLDQRAAFYHNLASARPSQKKFLRGWLNRVSDLGDYLGKI